MNKSQKNKSPKSRHWLKKTIFFLLGIQVAYLLLFNLALNLPLTQTLVNKIKPEKFQVLWTSAWTPYPFRVYADGILAKGQSTSQQWQVRAKNAAASISLIPLIGRKVKLYDMQAMDLNYSQQSLAKEIIAVKKTTKSIKVKKQRKPWDISLQTIVARGDHQVSISHAKGEFLGKLQGTLQADLNFQTRGGPFSVSNGLANINIESLTINGDENALKDGSINGLVEISPIIFKQNKGIKVMEFLTIDADIHAQLGSLNFLDLYLQAFKGMTIDGHGQLKGHLRYDKGTFLQDTNLKIDAPLISLSILQHRLNGDGLITAEVGKEGSDELNLIINFDSLEGFHEQVKAPLFSGHDLTVTAIGRSTLFPVSGKLKSLRYLGVEIPKVNVSNLSAFQIYIPEKWRIKLYAGEGNLEGKAMLSTTAFNAEIKLDSTDAEVGIDERRFKTDLDIGVFVDSPTLKSAMVDISGSYLRLDDSRLSIRKQNKSTAKSKSWQTALTIEKGLLQMHLPEHTEENLNARQVANTLKQQSPEKLLASAEAELKVIGHVSQLEWISLLVKNSLNFNIGGSGEVLADLKMVSGWLAKDSLVKIESDELLVGILDYHFRGDGLVMLNVSKGGESPDIDFKLGVSDALLNRRGEDQAFIENVELKLDGIIGDLGYRGPDKELELRMQIPTAHITDMSVYNQYFPENSPFSLTTGEASLSADIELKPEFAQGFVRLQTDGLQISFDEQKISAELNVDVNLNDGIPRDMAFDISGSSIIMDQVKVIGEQKDFNDNDWYAKISLTEAETEWKKPITLHTETEIEIKDSRPFVAVLSNHREKHGWISKLLTIEGVKGTAQLNIENKQVVIPYAFVSSDKIDLGAKGFFNAQHREGLFYARYRKLKGVLKVNDGEKNFDIIKAKNTFDEYSPVK